MATAGPTRVSPWAFLLGHRPLPWWREVTWKLEKTDCSLASLCQDTKAIVIQTVAHITNRTADEATKRRYDNAFHHILNNAIFEEPRLP
jgi:hypothetical protein